MWALAPSLCLSYSCIGLKFDCAKDCKNTTLFFLKRIIHGFVSEFVIFIAQMKFFELTPSKRLSTKKIEIQFLNRLTNGMRYFFENFFRDEKRVPSSPNFKFDCGCRVHALRPSQRHLNQMNQLNSWITKILWKKVPFAAQCWFLKKKI